MYQHSQHSKAKLSDRHRRMLYDDSGISADVAAERGYYTAHRRSEVDVINGKVVELSRALGLAAPYNETLCAVLRERESRFA